MGKRIIQTAAVLGAAAGLLVLLFFAVKTKRLQINRWIVSDTDYVGVDISEYQADVDMDTLREQGVTFIYMKATEGSGHVDGRFAQNWKNAQESGIPAGAYHFFSFDSPGQQQAENYIATVGSLEGKMIPAIDVEYYADKKENPPAREDVIRELGAFIAVLEKEYGVKPLIYCSGEIYEKYIAEDFGEYPRWVRSIYYPVTFEAGSNWVIWQYCDTARLEGYAGGEQCIDLNVLKRGISPEELMAGSRKENTEEVSKR
ncbi:MAG: hypothetical protein IJ198_02970 [Lachnospiraceae bacterium]|nr:hypothetical protein [Lachnospiraceae bacterium]